MVRALVLLTGIAAVASAIPPANWRRLETRRGEWGGRSIQYKVHDGWAVVEGDILLGRVVGLESAARKDTPDRGVSAVLNEYLLWPKGIIPYRLHPDLPDPGLIREAIRHWEERTPLRFVERTDEYYYVTFAPGFDGCSAQIGVGAGESFVNLSRGCDLRAVIHEIGHTAGLFHTQSRNDRDRWLRIRFERVDKEYWEQYNQRISTGRDIGPYDFHSVMHYSPGGFSRNGDRVMNSVPPGIPIGQVFGLTPLDIQAVHTLYGVPMAKAIVSTTPPGLQIVVDGTPHTSPAEFDWQPGETHSVSVPAAQALEAEPGARYEFAYWSDGGEVEHLITVGEKEKVFDARFRKLLKLEAGPAATEPEGAGGVEVWPPSSDGYYPLGAAVRLRPVPGEGRVFLSWCGPDRKAWPLAVQLNGCSAEELRADIEEPPAAYFARFGSGPVTTIATSSPGLRVYADDVSWPAPVRFAWEPGSRHTIEASWLEISNDWRSFHLLDGWSDDVAADEEGVVNFEASEESRVLTANYETWHEVSTEWNWYILAGSDRPDSYRLTTNLGDDYDYVLHGMELEVRPPESPRWQFANWSRDAAGAAVPLRITVTDHTVLGLNFLAASMLNSPALVSDARSLPGPVAPGQRLRVHWRGHVPDAPVSTPEDQPLPRILDGVEVRFDRTSAQLLSVSKEEIVCIVPETLPLDPASVSIGVVVGRMGTLFVPISVAKVSPGIYTNERNGMGDPLGRPAFPGETIEIRAGGLHADEPVEVFLGDFMLPAEHTRDESHPGIWRVRFQLPAEVPPGRTPIQLFSANRLSQPMVYLAIE